MHLESLAHAAAGQLPTPACALLQAAALEALAALTSSHEAAAQQALADVAVLPRLLLLAKQRAPGVRFLACSCVAHLSRAGGAAAGAQAEVGG